MSRLASKSVWFLLALAISPTRPSEAQRVALSVEVGKSTYFEDEPIYLVVQLNNLGSDTLWVAPFGLAFRNLRLHLTRNGTAVPEFVIVGDFVPSPNWRGVPIAPSEALYETSVLQDAWGTSDATSPEVFIRHLPTGSYELTAQFLSHVPTSAVSQPINADAGHVRFDIRQRTPAEDISFREFERVRRMAWNLSQRSQYLSRLLALIEQRVAADRTDPYLPFLLRNGIYTAAALGQRPSTYSDSRIAQLRTIVVESQRSLTSGAVLADALFTETQNISSEVSDLLRGTVAGRVAMHRVEQHRAQDKAPR